MRYIQKFYVTELLLHLSQTVIVIWCDLRTCFVVHYCTIPQSIQTITGY